MGVNSQERFSDRVENYIKYRPGYPDQIINSLTQDFGLNQSSVVADIGSGTGILSELFLRNDNKVFGVEPNDAMRQAGEHLLYGCTNFTSVSGTAEETTLASRCVDFVTAGQAFHWFDPQNSRREFRRILKPQGRVVLIWNDRKTDSNSFLRDYENFLVTYSIDYTSVDHKNVDDSKIQQFFEHAGFEKHTFENFQQLDYTGLKGRVLSSSYMPMPGQSNHGDMLEALPALFGQYEVGGYVKIEYDANMFVGRLDTG